MKYLVAGLLLAISFAGFCQNGTKNFIDQNYIEVTGKAEMDIVPDLIYLKIVLSDKDSKSKQSLDEIEKSMISKLDEIGVDVNKNLSVRDFMSSFKLYWISKSDIILTKEYQLIVHDTKMLQKVYFEFQKLGISNVSITKLDQSKIEQYRNEVKLNAIKAAKSKAESLTASLNQAIGKAIYIQELDTYELKTRMTNAAVQIRDKPTDYSSESSTPDVEFEKISLQYAILVRFELK